MGDTPGETTASTARRQCLRPLPVGRLEGSRPGRPHSDPPLDQDTDPSPERFKIRLYRTS
jgi:hypothetical protein